MLVFKPLVKTCGIAYSLQLVSRQQFFPSHVMLHCEDNLKPQVEGSLRTAVVALPSTKSLPSTATKTTVNTQYRITRFFLSILNGAFLVLRTAQLIILFLPPIVCSPLILLSKDRAHHKRWRKMFLVSLGFAGPAFHKLTQWASIRPDLFGVETAKDFHEFFSAGNGFYQEPLQDTLMTIQDAGLSLPVDPVPIGIGCVAQVHTAFYQNQPVAVKVQRRFGCSQVMKLDLQLGVHLATFLDFVIPNSNVMVKETIQEVANMFYDQLDFIQEASHLLEFRYLFSGSKHVEFPSVVFASPLVLIESRVQSPCILLSDLLLAKENFSQELRTAVAKTSLEMLLTMIFKHNFVHCDLHPGNIFVRPKTKNSNELDALVIVDPGMVARMEATEKRNFSDLCDALVQGDGEKAGHLLVDRSRSPQSCKNREAFAQDMKDTVDRAAFDYLLTNRLRLEPLVEKVLVLANKHQVMIEPKFTNLVISVLVLEGVARQLDSELDVFELVLQAI